MNANVSIKSKGYLKKRKECIANNHELITSSDLAPDKLTANK